MNYLRKIMNRNKRTKGASFPFYLIKPIKNGGKWIAFIIILLITSTILESAGQSYNPTIMVDAYNTTGAIEPNNIGYSTSTEFQENPQITTNLTQDGVKSMRILAPYNPGKQFVTKINNGVYSTLAADDTPYVLNQTYRVKLEVEGNNTIVYIDDEQLFNVTDSEFNSGEVALFTSYNQTTYFDNVSIKTPTGQTLFEDNFNSGKSNQWNTNGLPGFHDNGSWEVVNGEYRHIGLQSIALEKVGSNSWTDYTIEFDMRSETANAFERGFMGIMYRYQDAQTGYRFVWQSDYPHPYSGNNPWEVVDFEGQLKTAQDANLSPNVVVNMRGNATHAANLVTKLNIEERRGVEYFELGNEIWAWGDNYMPPETYAAKIKEFSAAMKAVDPSIKVGASLLIGYSNWDIPIIQQTAKELDFIVLHYYPPTQNQEHLSDHHLLASAYSYGKAYKSSYGSGDKGIIAEAKEVVQTYAPSEANRIEYLITEFNTFDSNRGKNLVYGLTAANLLGESIVNGAKRTQFHAIGASGSHWHPYTSDYLRRPSALAMSMVSKYTGAYLLPVYEQNVPAFSAQEWDTMPALNNVPYLQSYASRNADGTKLYLTVINKHEIAHMNSNVVLENANVSNTAKVYTLNGPSFNSDNEISQNINITESTIYNANKTTSYNFPPHSVTTLELNVNLVKPSKPEPTPTPTPTPQPEPQPVPDNIQPPSTQPPQPEVAEKPTPVLTTDVGEPLTPAVNQTPPETETKIVASAGPGGNPHVKTFNKDGIPTGLSFLSFNRNFRGGVSVAYADVNGDGKEDIITGAGAGGGPHVRVFDHSGKEILNFFPFHPNFRGGVNVAAGDVDNDGKAEIAITQASNGQAWTKVYNADNQRTLVTTFNAFGPVESGADVALGDIDKDGADEIIVGAGKGGGPLIRVFETDGNPKPIQFFAFHPAYRDGISVASGDADGDGKDEVVVAQSGRQEAWVKVYRYNNAKSIIGEWKAYGSARVGADVATTDLNEDGKIEIITGAGQGGSPHIRAFTPQGKALQTSFFAFDKGFRGGVKVAGK